MAKSLFKAVALVAVFTIITRLLGFVFRIYLSRELGAELLGVYQVAMSVFMVLVVLVSSGLPLAVSKFTAKYRVKNDEKAISGITTSAFIIGLFVSAIICLVFICFQTYIAKIFTDSRCMEILLMLLPAVVASSVYSAFRGALWGKQDYFSVGWTELCEQVLRIAFFGIMIFVCSGIDGASIAAISMTISCIVSALLAFLVYVKKGGKICSPKGFIKPVFKSSAPVTGVRTASSVIQPVIAVLFPFMLVSSGVSSETALSLFGIAMGMTFPLLFLPSTLIGSLSFALIPELSTALVKNQTKLVEERVKSGLLFSVIISALVIPLYVGLGPEICKLLFDNSQSGEFLIIASWIMIPLGLSNITSSILNAFNLEVKSFINNILGGVCLILCIVCFTGALSVYSLILGFGICMGLTTLLNIIMIKKHTKISLGIIKPLVFSCLFVIPCAYLSRWIYNLCLFVFPNFVSLIIGSCVAVWSFAVLCICFRLCDFAFIFSKIKSLPKFSKKKV